MYKYMTIATVILFHGLSGSLAIRTIRKRTKEIKRNVATSTVIGSLLALSQTVAIITTVKKRT
jgi:hypothetical protein